MTEITDAERQLLVVLLSKAWVAIKDDATFDQETAEIETLLRKISGVDKKVVLVRALAAEWTYDALAEAYYFAPLQRAAPPYLTQRHVDAILDIASDGTLAGVELIDNVPPPPTAALSHLEQKS